MKNKGFTLIELLAVIVILAIIALIAVPIILNIIDDAKKESDERSVELYAAAVKNGIAKYQLNEDAAPTEFSQIESYIKYDGARVECTTKEIYVDGNIYLDGCTVNGGKETYPYGEKQTNQVYKPQYYSWIGGYIGGDLPSGATKNVSELDTKGNAYYYGVDVDNNNKITEAYICFVRNETEYCLKGYDSGAFETNKAIVEDAFKDVENAYTVDPYDGAFVYDDAVAVEVRMYSTGGIYIQMGSWCCEMPSNLNYSFYCGI